MIVRPLLAGLAALSLSASAIAQSPAPAAQAAAATPDFSADAFRAHVTFLADDLLEGREAGTRGYDIASRYVATQFAACSACNRRAPTGAGTSRSSSSGSRAPATTIAIGGRTSHFEKWRNDDARQP